MGDLAIVLHSHMPYVEGFGTYPFGEEWLFDAVCRSYVPVMDIADQVTVTVTPVLADQLEAPGVCERLGEFLREFRIRSADADADDVDAEFEPACRAEAERYRAVQARLAETGGDLLAIFREPADSGRVELMASAASHAVLPLVATLAGRRLQLDAGLRSHRRRFGGAAGFWLPECAYEPGLEALLAERSLRYFCSDQSAHQDDLAALVPAATRAGPVAFTIDWEAVGWLWSLDGYPSDPLYADLHRKSLRGARPWAIGGGAYDPVVATRRAREQAAEFVEAASARLAAFRAGRGHPGLMVFAVDTELLGHWWWEGPEWLAEVCRLAPGAGVEMTTLGRALERHRPEARELARSSWGEGKDLRTWDSPSVADLAWAARRLELRLLGEIGGRGLADPAATRAARELLAVQASDWAFLDGRRQAGDYPFQRVTAHAEAMLDAIHSVTEPDPRLRNLAPDLSLAPLTEP
ncbi:MAG: 1,4-alpha-glucan branching protein domain-containing protein [bacterium]